MSERALTFYPYQQRWMQDASRFKIGMMSRQIGKTFTTAGEATDDCVQAMVQGRRARWVILSRGERQAAEAIREGITKIAQGFFAAYNVLKGSGELRIGEIEMSPGARPTDLDADYRRLEVEFPNGSRITALPASPDTARGFSGSVILDEFAFHQDSRAIWGALFPVISAGHKIRVISTPNGKGNKFYELMTAQDAAWSRHVVDIHQAVAQGLPRDVAALRAGLADEDAWDQEFELKWLDGASAWLDYDLIAAAEDEAAGDPSAYAGGMCFVGVDIAARRDLFVIWVAELVGDVLVTREVIVRRHISFAEQDALLASVFGRYRVVRCRMDQTGMGEKPVEDAQRRHGEDRVEGVLFTGAAKLDMATHLKERMQDRRLRIPAGDPSLRADLHAVRKETGATGIPRLVADSDAAGHADRFWAAAMCCSAAQTDYQPYDYRPVRPGLDALGRPDDAAPRGFRARGVI